MAASHSRLRADAPLFVPPASSFVPPAVAPEIVAYVSNPEVLPPLGLIPMFPCQAPPPPLGFPGCPGFPQGPGVGMPGAFPHPAAWAPPMPIPHGTMAFPAGSHRAPLQPQLPLVTPIPQDGCNPPSRTARTRRASGGRPRPWLDVPPRMQRAACPVPFPSPRGVEVIGVGGDAAAKGEPANEPSPRSVLVTASTPVSPTSSLPATFPLPHLTSPTPPASTGLTPATEPSPGSELATVGPPQRRRRQRALPPQQASGGEVRRRVRKTRRLFNPASNRTSLMIRNIPNSFTRMRLMNIIDQHCAEENAKVISAGGGIWSEYDFLYLPIDFGTKSNKGYAFVNVTTPAAARRLWEHLHGYRWKVRGCGKTCEVDHAAIQGRDALVAHFSGSCFDCETAEFLPVWFQPPRDGAWPAVGVQHVVGQLGRRS
ncbi:protein MEI2-like 6 [Phragmites australis]|uniref:protein MEI2-like 6 n=1 Tax=Phragmites australis TaxID=29695 RepID=UPI002D799AC4|nr:protein MEI2-like 6 [Phragmites australis]